MHSLNISLSLRALGVGLKMGRYAKRGKRMQKDRQNTILGKLVFAATAVAMVYFFWWLLIFDHGVISIQ